MLKKGSTRGDDRVRSYLTGIRLRNTDRNCSFFFFFFALFILPLICFLHFKEMRKTNTEKSWCSYLHVRICVLEFPSCCISNNPLPSHWTQEGPLYGASPISSIITFPALFIMLCLSSLAHLTLLLPLSSSTVHTTQTPLALHTRHHHD